MTAKKKKLKAATGKPSVSLTVDVWPGQVTVTVSRDDGRSVASTMMKDGPGTWRGTMKADKTTAEFEALFPDENVDEIEDIVSDLSSRGMDLHRELLLGEG